MKKITLRKIIYSNFLKSSLTTLLFVEIVLLLLYFSVTNYMSEKSVEVLLKEVRQNIDRTIKSEVKSIELNLKNIANLTLQLQNEHQYFFKNYHFFDNQKLDNVIIGKAPNNTSYKLNNNGGSSIIISKTTTLTNEFLTKVKKSEAFDISFKSIIENNKNIVAAYFNSYDNFSRYYPFIDKVYEVFPDSIIMKNYNFYYDADFKNNPSKGQVWTDAYLDPAGKGWMISSIVPIYNDDFLEGVTGLDITLNNIINNLLNLDLQYSGSSLLVDKNGFIIAMQKGIANLLNLEELTDHQYLSTISSTIYKPNKYNILSNQNNEHLDNIKMLLKEQRSDYSLNFHGDRYLGFVNTIKIKDWKVISLIKESEALNPINITKDKYQKIGYLAIGFILLFYVFFFIFLFKKSKELSDIINNPILNIIKSIKEHIKNSKEYKGIDSEIYEFSQIDEGFKKLLNVIDEKNNKLIDSQIKKRISEKLANTDMLTGAFNRRFFYDYITKIIATSKREKQPFSLLMIDLDKFKFINDNFGHDVGDEILKTSVNIINKLIRDNDTLIRFGGEEFVLILPNTTIENAKIIAQKIRKQIEQNDNQINANSIKVTVSIGVTEYKNSDENIDVSIKRADIALYKAKELGRNMVIENS